MSSSGCNSAAIDRHLKKIYDCLNIGCNKKAVQEVDRLPKNVRDLTVFRALKSLALIRMYKRRQAFELLNEINPKDDLDEVTLQTMTSCYKESVDVGKIVDLYEEASRRKPQDPEIMSHLFMAHVRVFNFKRQKEIALQMLKNFPQKERLYSIWAIMSSVMQSQDSNQLDPQKAAEKELSLKLAQGMFERRIVEPRTHEEIELYLIILRKQNKHVDEYNFLASTTCLRITDHLSWFNRRRAYLCLDLKMYSRAFKHYFPTLIQEYPDQIEYYQGLFKSAFFIDTEAPSQQQPVATNDQQNQTINQPTGTPVKSMSALAECYDIVEKQCILTLESVESSKDQPKGKSQPLSKNLSRTSSLNPNRRRLLRGPFIARIQLYQNIMRDEKVLPKNVFNQCKNQYTSNFPTLNSLLLDYFQAFSKKILCFYDLDYMINEFKLTIEDQELLVKSVQSWVEQLKTNQPDISSYDMFHIVLNYNMLKHSLHNYSLDDSLSQRIYLAKKFVSYYDDYRYLGKNTSKTDFQPVDNYCILAINSIMTNSTLFNLNSPILTDSILISLIVMAEHAIANSPSNHQLKLTLLKLYSFIGASKQCSDVLLSLDIRHFQIDTLGHLLNPVLYNTGNYSHSRESLETCLEFYAHGIRECFEGLTTSYRDGRCSKIEEISSVLKRLCDSLNATQCVLIKGILANLNATTLEELIAASQSFDPFKGLYRMFRCPGCTDTIKDSRDFKVLKSLHDETNKLIQEQQLASLEDEKLWLKVRYYLIRSAYIQLECLCGSTESKSENLSELEIGKKAIEELTPKLTELNTTKPPCWEPSDSRHSYFGPEPSLFRWDCVKFEDLIGLVNPLIFLSDASALTTKIQEDYMNRLEAMVTNLEVKVSQISTLCDIKIVLSALTITLEFISMGITSLVSLSHSSSASGGSKVPSSQPQQTSLTKSKSISNQMMNRTEAQLIKLSNIIKSVDVKALILDKTTIEPGLLSVDQGSIETKSGSNLTPLLETKQSLQTFDRVKEKLLDSYGESLKEIESTCRRKVKLLRL